MIYWLIPRGMRRPWFWLALISALTLGTHASVYAAATAGAGSPPPAPEAPAPQLFVDLDPPCNQASASHLPAGNLILKITPDPATRWQPPGGEYRFSINNMPLATDGLQLAACLRPDGAGPFKRANLRVINVSGAAATFGVQLPEDLHYYSREDLRLLGTSQAPWNTFDAVTSIWLTSRAFSAALAFAALGVAWVVMYYIAKGRGIKGNFFLRIISNRSGYASLSQFQIILWTFVLGVGVVYVEVLSGSLLDIPITALALLGISGGAALGAALPRAGPAGSSASPPSPMVSGFSALSIGPTGIVLAWSPPDSSQGYQYIPQQSADAGVTWIDLSPTTNCFAVVSGLVAQTTYSFQVVVVSGGVRGSPTPPIRVATAPAAPDITPAVPTGLVATATKPAPNVVATWSAAGSDYQFVQYRAAEDVQWTTLPAPTVTGQSSATVQGLDQNSTYYFRVCAVAAGAWSGWTTPVEYKTPARIPKLSDLVVWDGHKEVDVTRVQMLLFTVIAATFVLLKIFLDNTIPDIPTGFLGLMGLSNGVYLTAKFLPNNR